MSDQYNYTDTDQCSTSSDCEAYNNDDSGYPQGQWDCVDGKCVLRCYDDSDCGTNNMCIPTDGVQKCSDITYQDNIEGCLTESAYANFEKDANISNSADTNESLRSCVKWARKQTCNGEHCNYLVYKEPIQTPIDINGIDVKVVCSDDSTKYYPITSKVKEYCADKDSTNCVYNIPDLVKQDAMANIQDCTNYKVVTTYSCVNQDETTTSEGTLSDPVTLSCPLGDGNDFKAKCAVGNADSDEIGQYVVSNDAADCKYPLYKIPPLYSSQADLDTIMQSASDKELQNIQEELETVHDQMLELKVKKFMNEQRLLGNSDLDYDEAYALMEEMEKEKEEQIEQSNQAKIDALESELSSVFTQQQKTAKSLNIIEERRIDDAKGKLDNLDRQINTITSNIVKTQTKESIQVSIIKFLFILFIIVGILAVATLIYFNAKA
jgi:hypothetical protein